MKNRSDIQNWNEKYSKQITFKIAIMIILIFSISNQGNTQLMLQDYYAIKVSDGKLKIRWEPLNATDWSISKVKGYEVKVYDMTKGQSLIDTETVFPAKKSDWIKYEADCPMSLHDFATGARSLIYPDEKGNDLNKIFDLNGDKVREARLTLGFLMYSTSYDFDIISLSGLGYQIDYDANKRYKISIATEGSEPIIINVDPNSILPPALPELSDEWGNRKVEVKWDGSGYQGDYIGYMVSSSDDGLSYTLSTETPIMTSLGLEKNSSDLLKMSFTDSLAQNGKTYWYKVQGMDYFGELSEAEYVFTGQGYVPLGMSPMIEYANQTEDNHAEIKWYMPEDLEDLVRSYRITRADDDKSKFQIVMDSIPNTERSVVIPMDRTENHFRVEAVPYHGRPVGSISVFIMGQDTIPPAIPEVLGATIDSMGQILITWKANKESDLWGYRIFKSNFDNQEFGLLNSDLLRDTLFRDSVDLNFDTEEILYRLQSADKRDNRSKLSQIIRVQKPDVIPPGSPVIASIIQANDTIVINWNPSPSNDVVAHHLFRRKLHHDNTWTLVSILDSTSLVYDFEMGNKMPKREQYIYETDVEYEMAYSYTIIAYDEVGLKSTPTAPKQITMHKAKKEFEPINDFSYQLDEDNKNVTIMWDLNGESRLKKVLIYRGYSKNRLGKYKYLEATESSFTEAFSSDAMYYKIKPIYNEQDQPYFSETLEVISNGK